MDLFNNIAKSCNISVETIIKNYEKYLVDLNGVLFDIPQDKEIKKLVGYFDFSIANYVYVYNNLCTGLRSGKYCFGSKKYSQDVNFSFLLMLKLLVHDLITLRNLSIIGFDAQFHSISRNFVEKMKIFLLCCFDEEFFEVFTGHKEIADKELYNKYTRGKMVDQRIERLIEENPFDPTIIGFTSDTSKNRLNKLLHPFVHTNNYRQLLEYYGPRINISINSKKDNDVNVQAYKYMCEASILSLVDIILWSRNDTKIGLDRHLNLIFSVYQEYIKDYYTE